MHYTFKSKADADLLMMEPVGDHILRIVGKQPAARGIIEASAIPAAIAALEASIAVEERAHGAPKGNEADEDSDPRGERVSLGRRAWPMIEMMKRSVIEKSDIVWGV